MLRFEFGLSRVLPAGLTAAWGARWIFPNDMLPDRQSFPGIETETGQRLRTWLNAGALCKARAAAATMAKKYRLTTASSEEVTLYEDSTGIIMGSPNASYGYLYVAAWLKEDVHA